MDETTFKAMVVRETDEGDFVRNIETRTQNDLPDGDVLVRVRYSSLNYKDALSATGHRGVTRRYPHTPGVDAAGVVAESRADAFRPGDEVIVAGYDLGMNTAGGFGEYIRIPADWIVRLPAGLTLRESMCLGVAGFTAGQSIYALEQNGVTPDQGEILVTGATGGVGSTAVAILAKAGYQVVAATGKLHAQDFLRDLGAATVVHRDEVNDESGRPLLSSRWAGVVDVVGGSYLATAIKSTQYGGVVTCCGLTASPELHTTVYPFILRGVRLIGIDSAQVDMQTRVAVWRKLAGPWKVENLERLVSERTLQELDPEIDCILAGQQQGRILVVL
jgi:putative YhdH/YhfP family quinone oxidoreductase